MCIKHWAQFSGCWWISHYCRWQRQTYCACDCIYISMSFCLMHCNPLTHAHKPATYSICRYVDALQTFWGKNDWACCTAVIFLCCGWRSNYIDGIHQLQISSSSFISLKPEKAESILCPSGPNHVNSLIRFWVNALSFKVHCSELRNIYF